MAPIAVTVKQQPPLAARILGSAGDKVATIPLSSRAVWSTVRSKRSERSSSSKCSILPLLFTHQKPVRLNLYSLPMFAQPLLHPCWTLATSRACNRVASEIPKNLPQCTMCTGRFRSVRWNLALGAFYRKGKKRCFEPNESLLAKQAVNIASRALFQKLNVRNMPSGGWSQDRLLTASGAFASL